jgi:alanine racemase
MLYGHGLVEVSRAAQEAGAAWLGVARIEESSGTCEKPGIRVKSWCWVYSCRSGYVGSEYGLSLTIYDMNVAVEYSRQAEEESGDS